MVGIPMYDSREQVLRATWATDRMEYCITDTVQSWSLVYRVSVVVCTVSTVQRVLYSTSTCIYHLSTSIHYTYL